MKAVNRDRTMSYEKSLLNDGFGTRKEGKPKK